MITKSFTSAGVDWDISVPSTIPEGASLAGSEENLLSAFIDKVVYHSTLSGIRDDMTTAVAFVTGIARKTKVVGKKADGTDSLAPAETDIDYIERALAASGQGPISSFLSRPATDLSEEFAKALDGKLLTDFSTIKDVITYLNPFNAKPRERKPKAPAQPTKADRELAQAVFSSGRQAEVAAALGLDSDITEDSLAAAIRADRIARQDELVAKQKAALLGV